MTQIESQKSCQISNNNNDNNNQFSRRLKVRINGYGQVIPAFLRFELHAITRLFLIDYQTILN